MIAVEAIPDDVAALVSPALARHGGMVAVYDNDDRLRWANAAYREMMGMGPELGVTWSALMRQSFERQVGPAIHTPDIEHWLVSTASRRGKQPYRQFEADLCDGRWILLTQTVDARGWILCIGLDISDLGREHRELRIARDLALRASQVDPLTGIANRASVLQQLATALANSPHKPCVALIDLDHFKRINDTLGHAAGDQVLRDFSHLLQAGLRRTDTCGRYGGEEFLVVFNELSLAAAQEVVSRLHTVVVESRPLRDAPDFSYTFSAGLAQALPGEGSTELLARADVALYQAKAAGRNRCVAAR
ncbi:MAG: diguanylate cyclase [Vitreoscilla sp.]|nr:diguanylate cyclase [Vitreoscilla sp.]MBP6675113.1 diguanylate cyclase [Vitreoscilla sp.]